MTIDMEHKCNVGLAATQPVAARRLLLTLLVFSGCSSYDVIEPLAYAHVKSLYTVCNQKNAEQLERVADIIASAHQAGQLSSQEADWLEEIIADARNKEWQTAATKCRQLLEAQVKR